MLYTHDQRIYAKVGFRALADPETEFHKIWIERCAATEDIREQFGMKSALDYLIGEKLFTFVTAAEQDAEFAAELPAFVAAIRRLFSAEEIRAYLDHLERAKCLAPPEPEIEGGDEENLGRQTPCWARRNCYASPVSDNYFSPSEAQKKRKTWLSPKSHSAKTVSASPCSPAKRFL